MKNWLTQHPIALPTICFLLGILVADFLHTPIIILGFCLAGSCLGMLLDRRPLWFCITFLLLGHLSGALHFYKTTPVSFSEEPHSYRLLITGEIQLTERGVSSAAELLQGEQSIPIQLMVYEGVPELRPGDLVQAWGKVTPVTGYRNFGERDPVRRSQRKGIYWVLRVNRAELLVPVGRDNRWHPTRPFYGWRYSLRNKLQGLPETETRALMRALGLGDRSEFQEDLQRQFQKTGIAHLLAISGQHIGLVGLLSFLLFRLLLCLRPTLGLTIPLQKLAWFLAWFPTTLYVGLAGYPVSAIRAWILFSCLVFAVLAEKTRALFSALLGAALLIVLYNPTALYEVSFQLSFLAAGTLIIGFSESEVTRRGFWVRLLFGSLLITVITAPVILYYFTELSIAGLFMNLIAIPWVGFVILPLTLLTIGLLPLAQGMALKLFTVTTWVTEPLLRFIATVAGWDLTLSMGFSSRQLLLSYLALALSLLFVKKWWQRLIAVPLCAGLLLGGEFLYAHLKAREILTLTMLDVGQGDAIVLRLPDGAHFLIDGGGFYIPKEHLKFEVSDPGERVVVPSLRRQGVKELNGIILTHPHPDHFAGLTAVLEEFPVQSFYWNGDLASGGDFIAMMELLAAKGILPIALHDQANPLLRAGVRLEWLHPPEDPKSLFGNDLSLVIKVSYGDTCFLLTGDIEQLVERWLAANGDLDCEVLKVPHHLSRTSSSEAFLKAVKPRIAIASLGARNPFGFPHPEVLERYQAQGITLYRTDLHGAIQVVSDGATIKVKTVVK